MTDLDLIVWHGFNQKTHKPQRQLFPHRKFHLVGENIGVRNICYLIKRFIFSSNFNNNSAINLEVSFVLAILHSVFYRKAGLKQSILFLKFLCVVAS